MTDLSILCVTKCGAHSGPFLLHFLELANRLDAELVVAVDGEWVPEALTHFPNVHLLSSRGYIESVLDQAIGLCSGEYVLRMDDDEKCSPGMIDWLEQRQYRNEDHWAFPRMHLWLDEQHYITNPPLWPDLQTRLSTREKSGGRNHIHVGSPHGTGFVADVAIEHHKFLVRNLEEREALVAEYERLQPGAGSVHFQAFSVPEWFADRIQVGRVR